MILRGNNLPLAIDLFLLQEEEEEIKATKNKVDKGLLLHQLCLLHQTCVMLNQKANALKLQAALVGDKYMHDKEHKC